MFHSRKVLRKDIKWLTSCFSKRAPIATPSVLQGWRPTLGEVRPVYQGSVKCFSGKVSFNSVYSLTRSFRGRGDHPPTHIQAVPPPAPIPPSFPAQSMYPPPLQVYPAPYSSGPGLVPPPPVNYQPQAVYAPGPGVLNPPWVAPGTQPPLVSLPGSLSGPPLSKDDFYRQRHHRQDKWVLLLIWVNFDFIWYKLSESYCRFYQGRVYVLR